MFYRQLVAHMPDLLDLRRGVWTNLVSVLWEKWGEILQNFIISSEMPTNVAILAQPEHMTGKKGTLTIRNLDISKLHIIFFSSLLLSYMEPFFSYRTSVLFALFVFWFGGFFIQNVSLFSQTKYRNKGT